MSRLLFKKSGNAIWISHLDLMRLFQRAFKRAGLPLKHSQGFNPRPSVSIALPLSVGVESCCELLDFELDCDDTQYDQLPERLNSALVEGVTVLQVYNDGRKIRDLAFMRSLISLGYDCAVSVGAADAIRALLSRDSVSVIKKTRSGLQDQDIIPLIRNFDVNEAGDHRIEIEVLHCCQNPTLNPMQIPAAIKTYLPEYTPDFIKYCRLEIYDSSEVVFR